MNRLRRLSLARLTAFIAAALVVLGAGAAIAMAAFGSNGPTPPAKPLAQALLDGVSAPDVAGVSADIEFTNKLIDSSSLQGTNPILTGAKGRLWAAADGKVRLELQSSSGQDAQLVTDGTTAWVYDAGANTVYRMKLKPDAGEKAKADEGPPTLAKIEQKLAEIARDADLSRAIPGNIAGQPAYTVELSPKHDAGLLGGARVAWDAARGVPLRAAVYADGREDPVLELTATDITYGAVPASVFDVTYPKDAKVVTVEAPSKDKAGPAGRDKPVTGVAAVQAKLGFELAAPTTLVGLPRGDVRLVEADGKRGAIVTYGKDLGGIAVLQAPAEAKPAATGNGSSDGKGESGLTLPKISIDGATGQELATALGTVLTFERGGISYTVIGSVPPAAAEAAARDLR